MGYHNPLMVELMVPREPEVAARIDGFYQDIGWIARHSSDSAHFSYVSPDVDAFPTPTIGYWQTENPQKQSHFRVHEGTEPSGYATGLRLPTLNDLVEVCLVVPSDEDVHAIFERGGRLLEAHTHIPLREHAGRQEFRFADPFNYALRVTADPGWEVHNSDAANQFVTILEDPETNQQTPVVASQDLQDFAEQVGGDSRVGRRIFSALSRAVITYSSGTYIRRTGVGAQALGQYLRLGTASGGEVILEGIKPDKLHELVREIQRNPAVVVAGFGESSAELLLQLDREINRTND